MTLPRVDFELFGFLMIIGFLVDYQRRMAVIDAKYVSDMRAIEERRALRLRGMN